MTDPKKPKRITYITDGIRQRVLNKSQQLIVDTLAELPWITHYNFLTNVNRCVCVTKLPTDDEFKQFVAWWMVNVGRCLEIKIEIESEETRLDFIKQCMDVSVHWRFPSMILAFESIEEVHWKESNIDWEDHKAWYETQERLETVVIV